MLLSAQFPLKRLRFPTNWCVHRSKFYNVSPDVLVYSDKEHPNENYVSSYYYDEELLHIEYGIDRRWTLSLIWNSGFNTKGEKYLLSLSDDSWLTKMQTAKELTEEERYIDYKNKIKFETRSLEEITDAVNETMLKISVENGNYPNYPQGLQLQEFTPDYYVRYVKNEFFDIEPSEDLTAEQWKLFHEQMLVMEHYKNSDWQITAGWFPAFDPNGQYRIKVSLENLYEGMFEIFETKVKAEAIGYLDKVFSVHLKKLYEKYEKKVKSDKDRARQIKLQMQRNQKI